MKHSGTPWDEMDERQRRSAAAQVTSGMTLRAMPKSWSFGGTLGADRGAVEQQLRALELEPRSADTEARRKQLLGNGDDGQQFRADRPA